MASLRLKFPEKEEPSVIVLSGSRVTLGRLPLNTIQIIDRTLSGFHAEFVLEEDHFRLHDRGSTNGTFINGESVTDFHLREACKISFGALECEYSPETLAPAENSSVEALPTRSEINAVRQENAELKNRSESLREELDSLRKTRSAEAGTNTVALAQEEYHKLMADRERLQESQRTLEQEVARMKSDLAILQRDRDDLKKVAATAQAEFANFRVESKTVSVPANDAPSAGARPPEAADEEPAAQNVETPAAPASAPLPKPSFPLPGGVKPMLRPQTAPSETAEPAAPVAPAAAPLPKPSFPLPGGVKPAPKSPGVLPSAPVKVPVATSSGVRPVLVATPAPSGRPSDTVALKPLPRPPAPIAKGGTQKIDADAMPPIKPVPPVAKLPMKPPVKLPLQPTVKLQSGTLAPRAAAPANTGGEGDDSGS